MSEKRFTINKKESWGGLSDKQGKIYLDGSLHVMDVMEDICNILNEQDTEIKQYKDNLQMCREKALYWRNKAENIFGDMKTNVELQRENQTLYCQLNNFKLCKWDLDEENKLLKQALCETLQDTGDGHLIKIMDKLFELEYDKWESERYYEDWEETLELKELRDLYEK